MSDSKQYTFPCCHCGHELSQQISKLKAGNELWCNGPCGRKLEYVPADALKEIGRARRGLLAVRGLFLVQRFTAKLH